MVALLAEGVDRNYVDEVLPGDTFVALLAEGVDRNTINALPMRAYAMSPSSRRAWIEICLMMVDESRNAVALLAEGVDRNKEINALFNNIRVALLAEGVDRNLIAECLLICVCGRPPRGGRG